MVAERTTYGPGGALSLAWRVDLSIQVVLCSTYGTYSVIWSPFGPGAVPGERTAR